MSCTITRLWRNTKSRRHNQKNKGEAVAVVAILYKTLMTEIIYEYT